MRDAFIARLTALAQRDPRVMLVTGDLGFGVLTDFAKAYPRQFINAGVAEQNMTAIACGLAMEGRTVFTYSIANFTTLRCLEQLRNDVCYHNASVIAVAVGGGFSYGQLGMSHFATEDLAILRALPNMRVVSPCDVWEVAEAVDALTALGGPSYLRLDKDKAETVPAVGTPFAFGRARMHREGSAMTMIATGAILKEAIAAADLLRPEGRTCRVLGLHSVKPLDEAAIIAAARETGGIVTIEEHTVLGGLGGAVAELCMECGAPPRLFRRLGIPDEYPAVVGDQPYLRGIYGLDAAAIATTVRTMLDHQRSTGGISC